MVVPTAAPTASPVCQDSIGGGGGDEGAATCGWPSLRDGDVWAGPAGVWAAAAAATAPVDEQQELPPAAMHAVASATADELAVAAPEGAVAATETAAAAVREPALADLASETAFPSLGELSRPRCHGVRADGCTGTLGGPAISPSSKKPAPQLNDVPPKPIKASSATDLLTIPAAKIAPRSKKDGTILDVGRRLESKHKVKIEISRSSTTGTLTVLVTGKGPDVSRAAREFAMSVCVKQSFVFSMPASVRPYIIGTKGSRLKSIMDETGMAISFPKRKDIGSEPDSSDIDIDETIDVIIEGDPEGIEIAKGIMQKIVDQKATRFVERLAHISPEFHPFFAGVDNTELKRLEERYAVKIRIPFGYESGPLTVAGETNAIESTKQELDRICTRLQETTINTSIQIPKRQHRVLLADRSLALREIFSETECAVSLPPLDNPEEAVTIRGSESKLGAAISKVLDRANSFWIGDIDLAALAQELFPEVYNVGYANLLVRYIVKSKSLDSLGEQLGVKFEPPIVGKATSVVIWSRDKVRAQSARMNLISLIKTLPPHRITSMSIEPLMQKYIVTQQLDILDHIQERYSCVCLLAEKLQSENDVLVVYNAPPGTSSNDSIEAKKALDAVKSEFDWFVSSAKIITTTFSVPFKYQKHILGQNGSTLQNLIADQGRSVVDVKVSTNGTDQQKLMKSGTIIVRGPSTVVESVIKELEKIVRNAEREEKLHSFQLFVDFPAEYSKNLIGKGGSNITKLREQLNVKVELDGGKVVITGMQKHVEEAKKRIIALRVRLEDETIVRLPIPNQFHSIIIGPKGQTIKRLQDRYGVRVQLPREAEDTVGEEEHLRSSDEVIVKGGKKGVNAAAEELQAFLKYELDSRYKTVVSVPPKALPKIFGRQGSAVNALKEETNTRIDFSRPRDPKAPVEFTIQGYKGSVEKVKAFIENIVRQVDDEQEITLHIDSRHHGMLIGSGGNTLRDIITDAGGPTDRSLYTRMVQFARPGSKDQNNDEVVLRGDKQVIQKIADEFNRRIELVESKKNVTMIIPTPRIKAVIGRGGSVKRMLENKHGVSLYIPRLNPNSKDQENQIITLSGIEDNISNAQQEIEILLQNLLK